jgi:hypothetical protein
MVLAGPVISANIIRGGTEGNAVADRCTITFDPRYRRGEHISGPGRKAQR